MIFDKEFVPKLLVQLWEVGSWEVEGGVAANDVPRLAQALIDHAGCRSLTADDLQSSRVILQVWLVFTLPGFESKLEVLRIRLIKRSLMERGWYWTYGPVGSSIRSGGHDEEGLLRTLVGVRSQITDLHDLYPQIYLTDVDVN